MPRLWLLAGLMLLGLALAWLGIRLARNAPPAPRPNVLLVSIDTLRADRVGCYGHRGAATPVLDGLASRGARFATAVAHAPLTTPSHASILTGVTPLRHGIRDNGGFALPDAVPTLAEALKRAGYRTAAFVSGFPLDRRFGLGRGFDTYDDRLPHGDDPRRAAYVERPADLTTRAARAWLESEAGTGPWLLFVHYFDPHAPYDPPEPQRTRFEGRPYDGEVAFVDEQIGSLTSWLQAQDLSDRTIVLVTADHGESLGEHGEDTHGVFVYDATLRVPWIMAGPEIPAGISPRTVARGIDAAPTLLDLAGLAPPRGMEGRSLRPALEGRAMTDEPAYAESLFARINLGWAPLHAWRTERWKLIDAPQPELYALDTDAGETRDVSRARPEVAESMSRSLRAALAAPVPRAEAGISPEVAERLRALGYIGGGGETQPSLRHPKDGIGLINRLERGLAEARSDPPLARRELSHVLSEYPRMSLARRYRAIASAKTGDYAAAISDLESLAREGPSADDLVLLSECLRGAGRPAEALEAARRAEAMQARSPEPALSRARALVALNKMEEAAGAYSEVLRLAPGHPEALRGLGDIALRRGDLTAAARHYGQILQSDPDDLGAMVKLGVAHVRAGRLEEAVSLFRRAVEREPTHGEALADLGAALAKGGRPAEAIPYLERALDAGARSPAVLNGLGFARLEARDEKGALVALRASLALDPRQAQVAEVVSRLSRGRTASPRRQE